MQGPTRIYLSLRHHADAGLVAAVASTTLVFTATPFLLPAIVADFEVGLGTAGLISTAQVGTFALVVFVAGRTLRTSRRYLVASAIVLVVANLASIVAPTFPVLVMTRVLAGAAAGIMVWLGWAKAMRTGSSLRNVAAAGPAAAFVGAPLIGWLIASYDLDAVFLLLAVTSLPAAFLPAEFAGYKRQRTQAKVSRSNIVLIAALGLATLAGSATFVYAASLGQEIGLSATLISITFSANALAGFFGAKVDARGPSGLWFAVIAVSVALVGLIAVPFSFVVGMVLWGFAFWLATPLVMTAIADWSLAPEDRVGDAQSAMAVGRALGPAVGGAALGVGSFTTLAWWSLSGLLVAALLAISVDLFRRGRESPALSVD